MADVRLIDANALLDRNNWTIKQYSEKKPMLGETVLLS